MSNAQLARWYAPLWRQPWQGALLVAAILLAVAILQASHLVAANTSELGVWVAPVLMWGVCCGFINGLGFHPRTLVVRLLLCPWLAWPVILWGLWLTRSYYFS
ncbi:cyd operon protein YbgE [Aeromonas sp. RU39B]|jgi:cyd operon protein YbgE|uniref:cyd operon YbgE family protein n=1 Tax=Aeromonas sp. RU39B TaxID=1907416 RepID=UPI0009563749|nr:cyd operon YbgE family protein [Aeromonas sp. RU39B]SIQ35679.1 cyd operon protein YbgE [Aeromonas sp. RU39B]